jgi:hypothetical protein
MILRAAAVAVVTASLLLPVFARAEDGAVLEPIPAAAGLAPRAPGGHGDVIFSGGAAGSWTTSMQLLGTAQPARTGEAEGGAMSIAVAGRHAGFLLSLSGDASRGAGAALAANDQRFGTGGMSFAISASLHASDAFVISAGPAVEAHGTAVATIDPSGDVIDTWQGVVGGGAAHARLMLGRHVAVVADGFAGMVPVSGRWQVVDTASNQTLSRGSLAEPLVGAGTAALAIRPGEHLAIEGGIAARDASWRIDAATTGHERVARPFVGVGLVW